MNHTKEPWKYMEQPNSDWCYIVSEVEDAYIGKQRVFDYYGEREQRKVDAKRIVNCVNACADVEDKKLKLGYVKELEEENAELRKVLLQNGYNAKLRGDV